MEQELRRAHVGVFKIAGTAFESRGVDSRPEVHRRFPAEVILHVRSEGHPDVTGPSAPSATRAEEEPVLVARERRSEVRGRTVDGGSQAHGRAPRTARVRTGALRDPDVEEALGAREPGRLEAKYRLSPSLERTACWSLKPGLLMAGPTLMGSDQ